MGTCLESEDPARSSLVISISKISDPPGKSDALQLLLYGH